MNTFTLAFPSEAAQTVSSPCTVVAPDGLVWRVPWRTRWGHWLLRIWQDGWAAWWSERPWWARMDSRSLPR